jgi:phage-related minor tail protein
MATSNDLLLILKGDTSDIDKKLRSTQNELRDFASVADKFGSDLASTMKTLASQIGAAASLTPLTAIAIGTSLIGTAAAEAAKEYEEAFNTIIAKTGATGQSLAGLKENFETVFKSVPGDAQAIAGAISLISDRLQVSGEDVSNFAQQLTQLSSFSGAALVPLTDAITKAFQNWNVATKDQKTDLDLLNTIAQQTGGDVTQLASSMASIGNLARLSGVSFESTALQVGMLNAKGIDAQDVFQGISRAMATAQKSGVDLGQVTLPNLVFSIEQAMKSGNGLNVALDEFGAKAGPKMYELVQSGIISSTGLMSKSLDDSTDSIKKTYDATDTLGQQLTLLKNNLLGFTEPLAGFLLGAGKDFLKWVNTTVTGVEYLIYATTGQTDAQKKLLDAYSETLPQVKATVAATDGMSIVIASLGDKLFGVSKPLVDIAAKMVATKEAASLAAAEWIEVQKAAMGFQDASSTLAIFIDDVTQAIVKQDLSGYKRNIDATATAIIAARDGTATFWKEVETANLALDFSNSVLAAMPDLARKSITWMDGLGNSFMNVFDRVDQANVMLQTHEAILTRLGITSTAALQAEADGISQDVEQLFALQAAGQATQEEVDAGVAKMIAANAKIGQSNDSATLTWAKQKSAVQDLQAAAKKTFDDLSTGLAQAIVQGKSLSDVMLKVAQDVSAAIIKYAITNGTKLLIDSLSGVLVHLGAVGKAVQVVFASGATAAAKIATPPLTTLSQIPLNVGADTAAIASRIPSAASTGAGSIASGVMSGAMSILNPISAVANVVSAITGVLQLFGVGQGGQKDRLDIIANNTSMMNTKISGPGGLFENTWAIHNDLSNLFQAFISWNRTSQDWISNRVTDINTDVRAIRAILTNGLSPSTSGNVTINATIQVDGSDDPRATAKQIIDELKRLDPSFA